MTNPFSTAALRFVDQSLADAANALRKALRENTRARRNLAALIKEAEPATRDYYTGRPLKIRELSRYRSSG